MNDLNEFEISLNVKNFLAKTSVYKTQAVEKVFSRVAGCFIVVDHYKGFNEQVCKRN